jgi:hypothetical protein
MHVAIKNIKLIGEAVGTTTTKSLTQLQKGSARTSPLKKK